MIRRWFISILLSLTLPSLCAAQSLEPLTVEKCMELAIQNNVRTKLAHADTDFARGHSLREAADLLPQITAAVSQTHVYRENLKALGFSELPGVPSLIGPFNTFDARVRLTQNLLDLEAWYQHRSAQESWKIADLTENLVESQVAAAAALAFMEAYRAEQAIEAAQAGQELAQRLLTLAVEKRRTGSAASIEVARARTREAEEQLRVVDAQTASEEALLRLKHVIGFPLVQNVTLVEPPANPGQPVPSEKEALDTAARERLELQIVQADVDSSEYSLKSARSQHLPTVTAMGDVAFSGNDPDSDAKLVGSLGVGLQMPIFEGRRVTGKVIEAEARKTQADARRNDTRTQVEEDVRISLFHMSAATNRVRTTTMALSLAEAELKLARERYEAGVGDNVDVVNAQTVLARNQDAHVNATTGLKVARINLALALGCLNRSHLSF